MAHYLDLDNWNRRQLFDFFVSYDQPHFNICTQLDITELLALVKKEGVKISLALHYFALRLANEIEPFRYRLKEGNQVFVYDVINGGTTVLLPNETFSYAYFDFNPNFKEFVRDMGRSVDEVRKGDGRLRPTMRDDVIYNTSLPWISFTSFAHARTKGRGESVPRFVFGKFTQNGERVTMPFSVEVHHALVDGLHVGQFLERFEKALADPEAFIVSG